MIFEEDTIEFIHTEKFYKQASKNVQELVKEVNEKLTASATTWRVGQSRKKAIKLFPDMAGRIGKVEKFTPKKKGKNKWPLE